MALIPKIQIQIHRNQQPCFPFVHTTAPSTVGQTTTTRCGSSPPGKLSLRSRACELSFPTPILCRSSKFSPLPHSRHRPIPAEQLYNFADQRPVTSLLVSSTQTTPSVPHPPSSDRPPLYTVSPYDPHPRPASSTGRAGRPLSALSAGRARPASAAGQRVGWAPEEEGMEGIEVAVDEDGDSMAPPRTRRDGDGISLVSPSAAAFREVEASGESLLWASSSASRRQTHSFRSPIIDLEVRTSERLKDLGISGGGFSPVKLQVFREVGATIVQNVAYYGPLLARVIEAYEEAIRAGRGPDESVSRTAHHHGGTYTRKTNDSPTSIALRCSVYEQYDRLQYEHSVLRHERDELQQQSDHWHDVAKALEAQRDEAQRQVDGMGRVGIPVTPSSASPAAEADPDEARQREAEIADGVAPHLRPVPPGPPERIAELRSRIQYLEGQLGRSLRRDREIVLFLHQRGVSLPPNLPRDLIRQPPRAGRLLLASGAIKTHFGISLLVSVQPGCLPWRCRHRIQPEPVSRRPGGLPPGPVGGCRPAPPIPPTARPVSAAISRRKDTSRHTSVAAAGAAIEEQAVSIEGGGDDRHCGYEGEGADSDENGLRLELSEYDAGIEVQQVDTPVGRLRRPLAPQPLRPRAE
ncbi:hypothetical protein PAPYR_8779 [Paratrimastix pyriformis]|uniref:Uncharacterized protein n=1 Tax=Paratrimastix pyriformis TaxID=342808 RepID=A0ABQ8UDE1_9EUKA|nr:hypothetical protein PAPYR_8779 [Paratrimastix pyriformis]